MKYQSTGTLRRAMVARAMSTTGTRALGRLALPPMAHFRSALGHLADCGCRTCSSGLGILDSEASGPPTLVGSVVGKGVGLAAGAAAGAGAAALGAAAGSVVPVIGTVIGAVVGYLTSKLFGTTNYAEVYASIENLQALFTAYMQVAGQYPGRVYGRQEMSYIWNAAVNYGLFPGNGPPTVGGCTQAMITKDWTSCGNGQWKDWLGSILPGASGQANLSDEINLAIAAGVTNPINIAQQYLVPRTQSGAANPAWAWLSITNSRNPSLYQQMLIDTADVIVFEANPNAPLYYGTIPTETSSGAAAPPSAPVQTTAASSIPTGASVPPVTTTPVTTAPPAQQAVAASSASSGAAPQYATPGTEITATAGGGTLSTQFGVFSFGAAASGTNGNYVVLNGNQLSQAGVVMQYTGSALILMDSLGNVWQYQGGATPWTMIQAAQSSMPAAGSTATTATTTPMPAGYTEIGSDPSGNPVYSDANGVLYEWNGTAMTIYSGELSNGSTETQIQALLQQYLAQGQSQSEAVSNAIATLQSSGAQVTPDDYDQYTAQAATVAASPPVVTASGLSAISPTVWIVAGGVGLVAVLFFAFRKKGAAG
jgi:hypothetical protein